MRIGKGHSCGFFSCLITVFMIAAVLAAVFLPLSPAPAAANEPGTHIVEGEVAGPEPAHFPAEAAAPDDITEARWWPYVAAICGVIIVAAGLAVYFVRRCKKS